MRDPLGLLAILAHPDDESFGIGGTLAVYARKGVHVHLICATRGEAGEIADSYLEGFASIADRRVSELDCAATLLGLRGYYFLGYRDSGMGGSADNQHPDALIRAPQEEVTRRIVTYIRKLRPQVIITFDPIGGYMHPDHIAIQQSATRAFHLAGDPDFYDMEDGPPFQPQKLYYAVFPKAAMRLAARLIPLIGLDPRKFGKNGDIDILTLAERGNYPVHARINSREVASVKAAAMACHASQLRGNQLNRGLIGWLWRRIGLKETFMRAFPPVEGHIEEQDLFDGLNSTA